MVVQEDGLTKSFLGEKGVHDARRGMRFVGGFFIVYDRSSFPFFRFALHKFSQSLSVRC
jgi:hypothetical protein